MSEMLYKAAKKLIAASGAFLAAAFVIGVCGPWQNLVIMALLFFDAALYEAICEAERKGGRKKAMNARRSRGGIRCHAEAQ